MMPNWGLEVLSPTSAYFPNSNWLLGLNQTGVWTQAENKLFEKALAYFDKDTPDRWERVASMIPGKSVDDVKTHYRALEDDVNHIEAGLIPIPGYSSSSFTLDWENNQGFEGLKQEYGVGGKRSGGRLSDQERKKGVPWTEDEHRRFLMGLKKHGKGDWRTISRNFVTSRTPTQVASHAQKYFIRLSSGGKDKRRSSIHDITTVNLAEERPLSPSQSSTLSVQSASAAASGVSDQFSVLTDSTNSSEANRVFSPPAPSQMHGNPFLQPTFGMNSCEQKLQVQNSHRGTLNSIVANHHMLFRMQSTHLHPHG